MTGGTTVLSDWIKVKITSEATGASVNMTADSGGSFTVQSLSVEGGYTVTVTAPVTPDDLLPLFPMPLIEQEVSTERAIEMLSHPSARALDPLAVHPPKVLRALQRRRRGVRDHRIRSLSEGGINHKEHKEHRERRQTFCTERSPQELV